MRYQCKLKKYDYKPNRATWDVVDTKTGETVVTLEDYRDETAQIVAATLNEMDRRISAVAAAVKS